MKAQVENSDQGIKVQNTDQGSSKYQSTVFRSKELNAQNQDIWSLKYKDQSRSRSSEL